MFKSTASNVEVVTIVIVLHEMSNQPSEYPTPTDFSIKRPGEDPPALRVAERRVTSVGV